MRGLFYFSPLLLCISALNLRTKKFFNYTARGARKANLYSMLKDDANCVPWDADFNPVVHKKHESRQIICADSIDWLANWPTNFDTGTCGFTSLPDISELPEIYYGYNTHSPHKIDEYKKWFVNAAALFMSKLPIGAYCIFLQSDVRVVDASGQILGWIDKSHLCQQAADTIPGYTLMWHKLVSLDKTGKKRSVGRPTYSHFLCFGRNSLSPRRGSEPYGKKAKERKDRKDRTDRADRANAAAGTCNNGQEGARDDKAEIEIEAEADAGAQAKTTEGVGEWLSYQQQMFAVPDMFYRGEMLWPKGIGLDCCFIGVEFLRTIGQAKCIVDPFCGIGTTLSMADALGVERTIGIELSKKRCRRAALLDMHKHLHLISKDAKVLQFNDQPKGPHKTKGHILRKAHIRGEAGKDSPCEQQSANEIDSESKS